MVNATQNAVGQTILRRSRLTLVMTIIARGLVSRLHCVSGHGGPTTIVAGNDRVVNLILTTSGNERVQRFGSLFRDWLLDPNGGLDHHIYSAPLSSIQQV